MENNVYARLANVLDTLPNGFPSTIDGVEIKILKKIFTPDEADLFCDLKLTFEPVQKIAERTGRPLEGLEEKLTTMWEKGEILGYRIGRISIFKMVPWVLGIFEYQLPHMDRELAELCEAYMPVFGKQFFTEKPQYMQVIPVEQELQAEQETLTYEKVSSMIEKGRSFMLNECICRKEQALVDNPCHMPKETCLVIGSRSGSFDKNVLGGRIISKEEAYDVLRTAEKAGLVHLTWNVQSGHFFICNCCGCCCHVLRSINELNVPASIAINSHYYAEIDPEMCQTCGTCADDRCQVHAIEEYEDGYRVIKEQCIGCGLCVSTCAAEAIHFVRKLPDDLSTPPKNETAWLEERGRLRGIDFSAFQ